MAEDKNFSNEQLKAIKALDNVIVSAGAGSGKTTVLTERVRRHILGIIENSKPVALDELLILTFTNDAASSMKLKIKEALQNEKELAHLVPFVDSAHIETFDAYAQFIVTKYGYLENYPKNISVIEDDILSVKSANILDNILDEFYNSDVEIFKEIIFNYCSKNDNLFSKFLRDIYFQILIKKDNPIEYLMDYKENTLNEEYFINLFKKVDSIVEEYVNTISTHVYKMHVSCMREQLKDFFEIINDLKDIRSLVKYKEILVKIDSNKLSKIKSNIKSESISLNVNVDNELSLFEEIKEKILILAALSTIDVDAYFNIDIKKQIKYLTFIIDEILAPLVERIEYFKNSTGFFSFADIAKMAINIVKNHEDVRNELKNQYRLIMIDEYQDTSYGQEEFINLISNNNVFSVGDIKQSIYRFRGAVPDLFKEKYNKYKNGDGGHVVNMNNNYRSRKEIINPINEMFSILMKENYGGANYALDHIIEAANTSYEEFGKGKFEHGIYMIPNANLLTDNPFLSRLGQGKLAEAEATLICIDIINRIKKGYEVYDYKNKCVRKAKYSDFAILTYKSKKFDVFEKVFKRFGLPINAVYDESMREDVSINVISNLFKLLYLLQIENPTDIEKGQIKHYLISIFRSFIFEYDDQKLFDLFNNNEYFEDSNYIKLKELAEKYKNMPIHEIYLDLFKELDYLSISSKLKEAINAVDKNNIFFNKTKTMDKIGYTLKDFANYIEDLDSLDVKIDQTIYSEFEDAVTLTTVHKSKGLEYPLVYLPCLRDFSPPVMKNNYPFYQLEDKFFLPLFADPSKTANIIGLSIVKLGNSLIEEAEERLRLFYVALTRAKEDIVFLLDYKAILSEEEELLETINDIQKKYQKYKNNISYDRIVQEAKDRLKTIEKTRFGANFDHFLKNARLKFPLSNFIDKPFEDLFMFVKNNLEKKYEDLDDESIVKMVQLLFKEYINNNCSFNNLDIKILLNLEAEKLKNESADSDEQTYVLFNGVYDFKGNKILKVILYRTLNSARFVINLFPKITKTVLVHDNNIRDKIIADIKKENFYSLFEQLNVIVEDEKDVIKKFNTLNNSEETIILKELSIPKIIKEKPTKASKNIDEESDKTALNYGTHMHALLEIVDFKNPDLDFIFDKNEKQKVRQIVKLINNFDINNAEIFKEYQFKDEVQNVSGVIDLLIIKNDCALIIDYKLKNIDDEAYKNQLLVYKTFVQRVFKLTKVSTYLLSIVDGKLVEIKC